MDRFATIMDIQTMTTHAETMMLLHHSQVQINDPFVTPAPQAKKKRLNTPFYTAPSSFKSPTSSCDSSSSCASSPRSWTSEVTLTPVPTQPTPTSTASADYSQCSRVSDNQVDSVKDSQDGYVKDSCRRRLDFSDC